MSPSKFFKRILTSRPVQRLASLLIVAYIWIVYRTSRWEFEGREYGETLDGSGQGIIVAFWHQRLLLGPVVRPETEKRVFMLSSNHRDADFIVDAINKLGIESIRGSTTNPKKKHKDKSGAPALAQMIGALRDGHVVGITPDGPRGPRGVAHVGVIKLAQLSGAPIFPAAYSASRGWFLRTWDRFLLAAPFSKGCFVGGPPIRVPRDATPQMIEEARRTLQTTLTETARRADEAVGRSPDAAGLG